MLDRVLMNASAVVDWLATFLGTAKQMLLPFIYGFCIAYVISPIVSFFENRILLNLKFFKTRAKSARNISIIITYAIFIGCFSWLMTYLLPEIASSISNFFIALPNNLTLLEKNMFEFFNSVSFIDSKDVLDLLDIIMKPIVDYTADIPKVASDLIDGTLPAVLSGTVNFASSLLRILIGIFVGFYMLSGKEGFAEGMKKILYALFNKEKTASFITNTSRVNRLFQNFIVGKAIDSIIIGILCIIAMKLINAPYAALISVIVGITNMIPYFGPFIGAVPSIFIVLLTEPSLAIWVALVILVLQQFDGIVLGPKILGVSTGMAPVWIIFSITIGGALMGPLGMFIGVPIFASIKMFFGEYVDKKYNEKFNDGQ